MSGLPEIRHIVGEWIARAEEDLSTAELLLSQPGTWPLRSACFHAQQCIESITRADAEEAVKIARATRDAVRAHIGKPECKSRWSSI